MKIAILKRSFMNFEKGDYLSLDNNGNFLGFKKQKQGNGSVKISFSERFVELNNDFFEIKTL